MATRVSSDHNFHTFRYFVVFGLVLFLLWRLFFLYYYHPPHPVFGAAKAFNSDVSKWNTGAVRDMALSKCNLSLSFCGHAFHYCVFEINFSTLSDHNSHTFCLFLVLERYFCFCCALFWVVLSFVVAPCLLQCLLPHLCSIRTCQNGIQVR
jgi:surface protein